MSGYGPWMEDPVDKRATPFRQHSETGRIHEMSAAYADSLEYEAQRLRAALEEVKRIAVTWPWYQTSPNYAEKIIDAVDAALQASSEMGGTP